ncbi:MAG: capsule assembly Wzi family protein [Halomonadaceae bacterium]|nr:MAG: capsule assembly Wzi family protein [Halomonadaceae bacterium]
MIRLLTSIMLMLSCTLVSAAPWAEPGDMRLRHSLQVLADQGQLSTPLNTWPVMWSGTTLQRQSAGQSQARHGLTERAYLRFEQDRFARRGWNREFQAGAANQSPQLRSFNDQPREGAELGLSAQWNGHAWAAGLSAQVTREPADGRDWRGDGSYLAYTGDNWTLGVGAIERWWGPGWHSALVLSSNARPVPSVWLNRTHPQRSEHPLLAWLGPWQFTLALGQLESARDIPEPRLLAMRFNFRPLDGLELGLSRLLMYGGGEEPKSGSALWNAVTLSQGTDRPGPQSPTQMAAVDARYGMAIGGVSGGVYGEAAGQAGEDRSLGHFIALAGVDLSYAWGGASQRWLLEFTDTTAGNLFSRSRENVAYEDSVYRTGDRFRGRALGSTFDSDAQALILGLQHYFADGRNLAVTLGRIRLNRSDNLVAVRPSDNVDYAIAREAIDLLQITARYEYPLWQGWLTLDGQWSDSTVEVATADGSGRSQGTLSAGWRYRF